MFHTRHAPVVALLFVGLLAGFVLTAQPSQQAWAQREPVREEAAYADALELYNNDLYAQAARAFEAYRTRYSGSVNAAEALYYQARAELALGREERAVRLFDALQTEYPAHPLAADAQFSLGQYFSRQGNYEQARAVMERVLERNPDGPRAAPALYALGEAARAEEDYTAALDYLQQIVDKHRSAEIAPNALYAVASIHVEQGRYNEAAQALEQLSNRYPDAPQARTLGLALAEVYYELGNYQRALDELERRLPDLEGQERGRALFLRAEAHNQLGDVDQAATAYQSYLDRYPDGAHERAARYGLAWNHLQREDYEQAARRFAEVREGHTDRLAERATYYEAVSRTQLDEPREALSLYRTVADEWPEGPLADEALYELGRRYYELERWKEASEAFARLIEDHPDADRRAQALYFRGNALAAQGELRAALRSFEETAGLADASDDLQQDARFQRARLLYRTEQYTSAAEAFAQFYSDYPQNDRAAEALFWAGESFYQAGDLGEAGTRLRTYLDRAPSGEHANAARYALGWTAFKQGDYQAAARTFEAFLSSYRSDESDFPYREDAELRLADSYYALKQYDRAVRAYREVTSHNQDYALYQAAQALYFDDRSTEATNTLERLLADYPQSDLREEALYRQGYIQFQDQNYDAAIATYRQFIERHPNDPLAARAQYGIGDALYNAGRLNAAVNAYREVLDRYPDSPFASDAASGIQFALQAQGREADATALADSLVASGSSPGLADELRFRQAEAKYQSGRTEDALGDFQRFVRISSDERLLPEAYYYMGMIYADRGDYREAESYLQQVVEEFSGSARRQDAASMLGEIFLAQERYQSALEVYRRMEAMDSGDATATAEARYGQSMALLNMGETEEAERLLEDITEAAPATPEATQARLGLARIQEERGGTDEAARLYRRVADEGRGETGAEALYRLGTLLLSEGQPREAIEELSRLPDLFSGYADWIARSYLVQARAFRQLGETGNAVRLYDRVIDEFGDTAYADTAAREKDAL